MPPAMIYPSPLQISLVHCIPKGAGVYYWVYSHDAAYLIKDRNTNEGSTAIIDRRVFDFGEAAGAVWRP